MKSDRISKEQLFTRLAELYPQNSLDNSVIEYDKQTKLYDDASLELARRLGVKEKREWTSYGCGYASFFESWFYYEKPEFEFHIEGMNDKGYNGVFIIFSLLEPMFSAGEAHKTWSEHGGSGMLPSIGMIDEYSSSSVKSLSANICKELQACGIPQASKGTLEEPIDQSISIESNMATGELKLFDAFYHWID